jgi:predicted aspartyl protease
MYYQGYGVAQDYAQAVAWYRKAADKGDAVAQNNLGLMYSSGQGVLQDNVRAYMWFSLAASGSDGATRQKAVKERDDLAANMTPAQIAEARRQAGEWKPSSRVGDPRGSGGAPSVSPTHEPPVDARGESAVPMVSDDGTFKVPVTINGQLTLKFVVDSGAADVSIPADVVGTLVRTETITDADFLGKQTYQMADGSTVPSMRFVIRSLKVGDKTLENVTGSIAPLAGSLLLGQSFLSHFKSWSIDNQRRALILN